jgi:hypothetical protein
VAFSFTQFSAFAVATAAAAAAATGCGSDAPLGASAFSFLGIPAAVAPELCTLVLGFGDGLSVWGMSLEGFATILLVFAAEWLPVLFFFSRITGASSARHYPPLV